MQDDYDLNQAICFSLKKSGYGVLGAAFMEKGLHQSGRHRFLQDFTVNRRRTFMVLLSLAASLSVYLCVVTMLDSQAARTIVSNFMDSDLIGWNGSIVERIRE